MRLQLLLRQSPPAHVPLQLPPCQIRNLTLPAARLRFKPIAAQRRKPNLLSLTTSRLSGTISPLMPVGSLERRNGAATWIRLARKEDSLDGVASVAAVGAGATVAFHSCIYLMINDQDV